MAERRDAFDRAPLTPVAHPRRQGAFLFASVFHNIHNVGDICAAGILPIAKTDAGMTMLLAEEDTNIAPDFGSRIWAPGLGMLGGKVDAKDSHWLDTVKRELDGMQLADRLSHWCAWPGASKNYAPIDVLPARRERTMRRDPVALRGTARG